MIDAQPTARATRATTSQTRCLFLVRLGILDLRSQSRRDEPTPTLSLAKPQRPQSFGRHVLLASLDQLRRVPRAEGSRGWGRTRTGILRRAHGEVGLGRTERYKPPWCGEMSWAKRFRTGPPGLDPSDADAGYRPPAHAASKAY